jgi:hypothetical protein
MLGFWRPGRDNRSERRIEQLLRRHRGVPRDEFVATMLDRVEPQPERTASRPLGGRVLVAAVVTALAVGAGVAAGATHVAGTSITNLVHVANSGLHGSTSHPADNHKFKPYHHHPGPGDHQYVVPVCHHTHSRRHPWIELFLPPRVAAFFVRFFPPDYIVGADGNPDTCPP